MYLNKSLPGPGKTAEVFHVLQILREWRMMKIRPAESSPMPPVPKRYDSTHLGIGLLLSVTALLKLTEFIIICVF